MQEYLNCSMKTGMYVSFPSFDTNDLDPLSFVQVLAINQKYITAKSCKPLQDDNNKLMIQVSVQPLERMLPFGADVTSSQQAEAFIYGDERPLPIQLPLSPNDRPQVLQWRNHGQSDL